MNTGENDLYSAVIDTTNGYAYFGTNTHPGIVVKIQLSDFTRVGALTLNTDEDNLAAAVIDTTNGYAYFGSYMPTGMVMKIRLSDFTRIGAVTLSTEDYLWSAVIDTTNGHAYFGSFSSPGKIVKTSLQYQTLSTANSQTITVNGNLTSGDGTNPVNIFGNTYNPTINVSGNLTNNGTSTFRSTSGTLTVGANWSNYGAFTHNSGTVIFNATTTGKTITDGGSAFYNLTFNGTNGEWLYKDGASTAPYLTTVQAGIPIFLNAKTGPVSVTGGELRRDWYLGVHVVDAAATSTNIDTGDNDISIIEATGSSTVWKYENGSWGNGSSTQTTGSDATGKNSQPNATSSIRIREYSKTSASTAYYKYNLTINATSTYIAYNYYNNYGSKYLASVSSTAPDIDAVVGELWHRSVIANLNTPYDAVNNPPTKGSWYAGMTAEYSITLTLSTTTINFGSFSPGMIATATNTLTVETNNPTGFILKVTRDFTTSTMTLAGLANATNTIPDQTAWNSTGNGNATTTANLDGNGRVLAFRVRYSGTNTSNYNSTWWGIDDTDANAKFAGFPPPSSETNTIVNRTSSSSPATDTVIFYRLNVPDNQYIGSYSGTITYTVTVNP